MLSKNNDYMKAFLKVGCFLLGAILILTACGIFVFHSFFDPGATVLTDSQTGGLVLTGLLGALSIIASIIMEYGLPES